MKFYSILVKSTGRLVVLSASAQTLRSSYRYLFTGKNKGIYRAVYRDTYDIELYQLTFNN